MFGEDFDIPFADWSQNVRDSFQIEEENGISPPLSSGESELLTSKRKRTVEWEDKRGSSVHYWQRFKMDLTKRGGSGSSVFNGENDMLISKRKRTIEWEDKRDSNAFYWQRFKMDLTKRSGNADNERSVYWKRFKLDLTK